MDTHGWLLLNYSGENSCRFVQGCAILPVEREPVSVFVPVQGSRRVVFEL